MLLKAKKKSVLVCITIGEHRIFVNNKIFIIIHVYFYLDTCIYFFQIANVIWVYYISKLVEFLDTV